MYTGKEGVIGRVGRSILVGQGAVEFLCFDLYRSTSTGRAEHWPHSIPGLPRDGAGATRVVQPDIEKGVVRHMDGAT